MKTFAGFPAKGTPPNPAAKGEMALGIPKGLIGLGRITLDFLFEKLSQFMERGFHSIKKITCILMMMQLKMIM
jgi:hypothetical protein